MTENFFRYAFFVLLSILINLSIIIVLVRFDAPQPASENGTFVKLIKNKKESGQQLSKSDQHPDPLPKVKTAPVKAVKKPLPIDKKTSAPPTKSIQKSVKPEKVKPLQKQQKTNTIDGYSVAFIQTSIQTTDAHLSKLNSRYQQTRKKSAPQKSFSVTSTVPNKTDYSRLFAFHEVDIKPQVIHSVKPLYPMFAKRRHLEGELLLRFIVDKTGQVKDIQIITAKPADIFNENTLDAVKQYRFSPGKVSGTPVKTEVELPIRFTLKQ